MTASGKEAHSAPARKVEKGKKAVSRRSPSIRGGVYVSGGGKEL